jgi:MFS family permease
MRKAMLLILLLGLVSLCGDIVYEGARAVTGPFLYSLGATAAVVGLISGIGEFAGYALRLLSGYLVDRTCRYWTLVFIGYGLIVAIPLLAFAGRWEIAACLVIAERLAKAIRTPAREVILSSAGKDIGRGWAFGIHEAMDQIGAVGGPLILTAAIAMGGDGAGHLAGYRMGFKILFIPFVLMLAVLVYARWRFPEPQKLEKGACETGAKVPRVFWLYLVFICLTICGFANFQLVSFHLKAKSLTTDAVIPLLYAVAMGVDAVAALTIGKLYDKRGMGIMIVLPLISIAAAPLVFASSRSAAIAGIVLWGIAIGIHETIMRAAIGDMVPIARRGWAYGIFYLAFGLSWFVGSLAIGALYAVSITAVIIFAVVLQAASVPAFFAFRRELAQPRPVSGTRY